jgi:Raf kinase inhibitor-like YbhB/YbcL family protein
MRIPLHALLGVGLLGACGKKDEEPLNSKEGMMAIKISSSAFESNRPIPKKHTGEGPDVSPALSWTGVPPDAKELALICDDPDAPTPRPWVHWVLYKLLPTLSGLQEGDSGGGVQGKNDFEKTGYGGPLPPKGHGVHHYHFKLYALDRTLEANPGLTKDQILANMKGHILAEGELVGTYERR